MASYRTNYTAEFFKKDRKPDKIGTTNDCTKSDTSRNKDRETSSDSAINKKFNNKDKRISRLYKEVVDEIIRKNKITKNAVKEAIIQMKQDIHQGHKRGFKGFRGIDFSKPENRCGYLRRYAICHTGLVKKIMWNFFLDKGKIIDNIIPSEEIRNTNHLKVISLGGGPGNDLVGFCCALQEITNTVKELDLYIVDISEEWETVFPTILQIANLSEFGTFSQCLKEIKMNTGFMKADLTADGIFEDETLSPTLNEVDVILMVKLTSFLSDKEAGDLIYNVVNSMKTKAKLIFIDQPYDSDFFQKIKSLTSVYSDDINYELSFKPANDNNPSIDSAQAHVGIYVKKI